MSINFYHSIIDFLEYGGAVIEVIFIVTFIIWLLIIERYWYCAFQQRFVADKLVARWHIRCDKRPRASRLIRSCWLSQFRCLLEQNIGLIEVLVSVSLLLGLLGTVTGMIGVFEGMSTFDTGGQSGIQVIVDGVTVAIIPAMAGMIVALSGVYFSVQLKKRTKKEVRKLNGRLTLSEKYS